jgi:hypothetical protein
MEQSWEVIRNRNIPLTVIRVGLRIHNHDSPKNQNQFWHITMALKFLGKKKKTTHHKTSSSLLILSRKPLVLKGFWNENQAIQGWYCLQSYPTVSISVLTMEPA